MSFGIYVHIPYCIQRCLYCDFATYEQSKILPPQSYLELVLKEIEARQNLFSQRSLNTLYFGGGTPSLVPPEIIISIIRGLEKFGFKRLEDCETTIEINPATISDNKLDLYLENGINRFSVGAQTFKESHLKMVGREHNSTQTLETLNLLKKRNLNFSFDILFGLPGQTIKDLERDLDIGLELGASHISPYCLTVPQSHPLSKGRPPEDEQVAMFELICDRLQAAGYYRYEISNFSKPNKESRHNLLYWTDEAYWGIGLSAHSYNPSPGWGRRFWNVNNINDYEKRISSGDFNLHFDEEEVLEMHQALTDFCHTSLRLSRGLSTMALEKKFGKPILAYIHKIAEDEIKKGLLVFDASAQAWRLTEKGIVLSNQVFQSFTFLVEDIQAL